MHILTNANIIRKAAHVNVGNAFLFQLCTQRRVGEFFVIPKNWVRIDFRVGAFVHFDGALHNLTDYIAPSEAIEISGVKPGS